MKNRVLSVLMATLCTANVMANEGPNWNTVEIGQVDVDIQYNIKADGFKIGGTYLLNENFFVLGEYQRVRDKLDGTHSTWEFDIWNVGAGYRTQIMTGTDLYASLAYEEIETSLSNGVGSSGLYGFSGKVGLRTIWSNNIETDLAVGHLEYDHASGDDVVHEFIYEAKAYYHFNDHFSLGLAYRDTDVHEYSSILAKYSF